MTRRLWVCLGVILTTVALAAGAAAQPLGTFRWQLEPYCNVVTMAVTQNGAVYRLEGTDDQCGNGAAASAVGLAFPNADGTIGFGLTIVTTPGGEPLHVDAAITLSTLGGTWRDSAGATGAFTFTPGAGRGGSVRPLPVDVVPPTIVLRPDGGLVAGGTEGTGAIPATGPGSRLMWYPGKSAFRAGEVLGQWDDALVGNGSVALGRRTTASNNNSVALGSETTASGINSTAMGSATTANAPRSTAMGSLTTAGGEISTAMGSETSASGEMSTAMGDRTAAGGPRSTAMGSLTTASGEASTALGERTVASGPAGTALGARSVAAGPRSLAGGFESRAEGHQSLAFGFESFAGDTGSIALGFRAVANSSGSFVFADRSTNDALVSLNANEFMVRAAGGVQIFSNGAATLGVRLATNGTQWLANSDARIKHGFRELDGDDVLTRIAGMPVTEWSYTAQDAAIRHIGPTAQDFHAAFGLGEDPLRIGTLDADGVALAAVKALEARSRSQAERTEQLEQALARVLDILCARTGDCR